MLTQGLGTILRARHLLLVATGAGKAEAVAAAVEGPLSASCPASVLQLHPHATVLLDEAAAARLRAARLLPRGLRRQAGLAGPLSHRLLARLRPWSPEPGSTSCSSSASS